MGQPSRRIIFWVFCWKSRAEKNDAAQEFQAALGLASEYRPAQDALARVSR